ncbi:hypothetical protein NPIL_591471 [Nephila pilipes]|uniref:Uncharacterized protein n=1 Tax=Nephila pilipes TaxID=299642 RepID=A0A8X6UQB1_NEPPI|nr:hypothetical protein NPIL_591471 [Nephila pilipes]
MNEHAFAKVTYFYHKKDADTFFKFLQDFHHHLLTLQSSQVFPLNLSYQDLLSQPLKKLHLTHDPSHVANMRECVRVEIKPSQFDEEHTEQLAEKEYGAYPYIIGKSTASPNCTTCCWRFRANTGPSPSIGGWRWLKRCWIRCTPTTGVLLLSKRPNSAPSACK